jgi:hypothetical protein
VVLVAIVALEVAASGTPTPTRPSVDQLVVLDDSAFCTSAADVVGDDSPTTPIALADLWRLWRRLESVHSPRAGDCSRLFSQLAVRIATSDPEDVIRELALSIDEASENGTDLTNALADAWVEREIRRLEALSRRPMLKPPPDASSVPAHLEGLSPDLETSWHAYRALTAAAEREVKKYPRLRPEPANYGAYLDRPLARFLQGTDTRLVAAALRGEWRGFCGNGINLFLDRRSQAILMGALHDHSYATAVLAALRLSDTPCPNELHSMWSRRLFAVFGMDWEQLTAGAALDDAVPNRLPSDAFVRALVEYGSERAIQQLLDMWTLKAFQTIDHVVALSALVAPARNETARGTCNGIVGVTIYPQFYARRAKPIDLPEEVERAVVRQLGEYLRSDTDPWTWSLAIGRLANLRRPESREALERATTLPDEYTQQLAQGVLAALSSGC